jgi:hypothetical protein
VKRQPRPTRDVDEEEPLMKAPQVRLRSVLILIALVALLMAGVATALKRPGRPYSTVFAGFDPVVLLASRPGYTVKGVVGWNVFSANRGYAFREWRGVVTAPNDPSIRHVIQKSIEGYIEQESHGRCHTEGALACEPHETSQYGQFPAHALFMFNEGDRHGDLHVWLFPDSSGSGVGYAIFLREEPFE